MKDQRTALTPSKRTHDFMHACLSESLHSVRFQLCHLDTLVFEKAPLCFCQFWGFLHRERIQAGSLSSLNWTHPEHIWNQFFLAIVLIKRIKSSQVALNHIFPYTSSDPSGGPIKVASIHTYLLPDLPSSLTLFPVSKEYWYKRMLIPVQNGFILCHRILIFSYLQVYRPLSI